MKFTLSWLHDFLETQAPLADILDALNNLGLEVESVDNPSETLKDFKVGQINSTIPHPDADRLQICDVQTEGGLLKIVCGAKNARAGLKVCVSLPNMFIPGLNITLKKGKIRGIESQGMLCSLSEIGFEDAFDGIIEMPEHAQIGDKVVDILGLNDATIDIAITPNRPDALGVYGIARDLAAYGLGTLKPLSVKPFQGTFSSPITVTLEHPESSPHFVGAYVKNVTNTQSPQWVQKRLKAIGCNPKSVLVDITNYISYSFARPLHVFDADCLEGNITVGLGKVGEAFLSLKEQEYCLTDHDIVVRDTQQVHALAGVMGGLKSASFEHTKNVFLESAYFNPDFIARTGRRTGILSDARYRFERGIDPAFTQIGAELAIAMILDYCGGEASHLVVAGTALETNRSYLLKPKDVQNFTSVVIDWQKQQEILISLGFKVDKHETGVMVCPPSYRVDIKGSKDLIEEIIRIHGINHVPAVVLPTVQKGHTALSPLQQRREHIRNHVAQMGYLESVSYSFVSEKHAQDFSHTGDLLPLSNPISSYLSHMRPSILASLLTAVQKNIPYGKTDLSLFEIGRIFLSDAEDKQPFMLGMMKTGKNHDKHWRDTSKAVDMYDMKQDIWELLSKINMPVGNLTLSRDVPNYYHTGRSARFSLGNQIYGYFGELHPRLLQAYDIAVPVMGAELFVDSLPLPKSKKTTAISLLNTPLLLPVTRDFAVVVGRDVLAENLIKAVKKADKKYIIAVDIFDIYMGEHMDKDKKSVALRVTLQPIDLNFVESDLELISQNILASLLKDTGAVLR